MKIINLRSKHQQKAPDQDDDSAIAVDDRARKIFLFGPLTDAKATNFLIAFNSLDTDEGDITVCLNSPGGNTIAGYCIYDVIKLSRNRVIVEGYGEIFSMAVLVLQAGDERRLAPQSELMVHDVHLEGDLAVSIKEASKLAADLVAENKRYQELVCHRSKIPAAKLAKMCAEETFLKAPEAVALGFADRLIESKKGDKPKKGKKVNEG